MLGVYLPMATLLLVALLFGGMLLFFGRFCSFPVSVSTSARCSYAHTKSMSTFLPFCDYYVGIGHCAILDIGSIQYGIDGFCHVHSGGCSTIVDASDKSRY